MPAGDVILSRTAKQAVSATAEYIVGPLVPVGQVLHLTSVFVDDADNTWTYANLIARRGGSDVVLSRYYPAAAVKFYTFAGDWWLPANTEVVVMLSGATLADDVSLVANGVMLA